MIRVQQEDFDVGAELAALSDGRTDIGGIASFVGTVRDMAGNTPVSAMTLEHYPGMTEKQIAKIEAEAHRRWPLAATTIIHRLRPAGTGRPHRLRGRRLGPPRRRIRRLPLPDRLAEDQGTVLEVGGHP